MSDQQAMSRDELVAAIEAGWDALSAFLSCPLASARSERLEQVAMPCQPPMHIATSA